MQARSPKYSYKPMSSIAKFIQFIKSDSNGLRPYLREPAYIDQDDIITIADNFKFCPNGTVVKLYGDSYGRHNISKPKMKYLAEALGRGEGPEDFHLNVSGLNLGDEGAEFFANALKTGKVKKGTHLDLGDNDISDNGIRMVVSSLKYCPEDFCLNLSSNHFTPATYDFVANSLKMAPKNFHLVIEHSYHVLHYRDEKCFIQALDSADLPAGLKININWSLLLDIMAVNNLNNVLLKNTAIIDFTFAWGGPDDYAEQQKLNFYLKRNRLLMQFPEFYKYIKDKCAEYNFYTSSKEKTTDSNDAANANVSSSPLSLFSTTSRSQVNVPDKIQDFIREMSRFSERHDHFKRP